MLKSCTTSVQNSCVLHAFWGEKKEEWHKILIPLSPCSGRGFGCGKTKLTCVCARFGIGPRHSILEEGSRRWHCCSASSGITFPGKQPLIPLPSPPAASIPTALCCRQLCASVALTFGHLRGALSSPFAPIPNYLVFSGGEEGSEAGGSL